ncbi:MAG TPA: hypothetical protein VHY37_04590 [Tepidisphaeraceae bacterium]|jgi:hypothetical protein|nr:hypothetical protein [Tepidisphaeraceae bacterium]
MTRVRIRRSGTVVCRAVLRLPLSAQNVWGQLRDFSRYAQQDVFHADIRIAGGTPKAGAELTMTHGLAGISVTRIGRILWWREGVGYSFSDLSRRGPRCGFPHIFSYRIKPDSRKPDTACTLIILVRGKWTARFIPRPLARLWLKWVFSRVVHNVENNLLVYRLWRRNRFPGRR